MRNFKALLDSVPAQIDAMLKTLQEMKIGSTPDESADYWEERKKIDQNTSDLQNCRDKFDKLHTLQRVANFATIIEEGLFTFLEK